MSTAELLDECRAYGARLTMTHTQPSRAGLTFGGRPSGPCSAGLLSASISPGGVRFVAEPKKESLALVKARRAGTKREPSPEGLGYRSRSIITSAVGAA